MSYTLHKPTPHVTTSVRRVPLAAMPGFRAVCSCGESTWVPDIAQVGAWEYRHAIDACRQQSESKRRSA